MRDGLVCHCKVHCERNVRRIIKLMAKKCKVRITEVIHRLYLKVIIVCLFTLMFLFVYSRINRMYPKFILLLKFFKILCFGTTPRTYTSMEGRLIRYAEEYDYDEDGTRGALDEFVAVTDIQSLIMDYVWQIQLGEALIFRESCLAWSLFSGCFRADVYHHHFQPLYIMTRKGERRIWWHRFEYREDIENYEIILCYP